MLLLMGVREGNSLRFEYLRRVREYRSNAWKDFMNEYHIFLNVKVASDSDD
jgi:hypothetical protein